MKAIVSTEYGSPDVLELKEVEKPVPKDNEVLIKVHAAAANPLDWHRMRGAPFLVRLSDGLFKPKNRMLGADLAGRVEAVGNSVTEFQPGDEVFGEVYAGGFAEYACVSEDKLALKPANLSFEEAAAVPVAALTALQGLRDYGQIQAGQRVLINGSSGGVGTFAVQLAKHFEAEVTAVCSTRNVELAHSLGADHVIDYTQEVVIKAGQSYNLILDNVGNLAASDYKRGLTSNGIGVIVGFTTLGHMLATILQGKWMSIRGGNKVGSMLAQPNQKDMALLANLLEAGHIKSVIDKCYPLSQTAEAIRYLEEGHARGKVIITVGHNNKT